VRPAIYAFRRNNYTTRRAGGELPVRATRCGFAAFAERLSTRDNCSDERGGESGLARLAARQPKAGSFQTSLGALDHCVVRRPVRTHNAQAAGAQQQAFAADAGRKILKNDAR